MICNGMISYKHVSLFLAFKRLAVFFSEFGFFPLLSIDIS